LNLKNIQNAQDFNSNFTSESARGISCFTYGMSSSSR